MKKNPLLNFNSKVFQKVLLANFIIILLTVLLLTFVFFRSTSHIISDNYNEYSTIIMTDMNDFFLNKSLLIQQLVKLMYANPDFTGVLYQYLLSPMNSISEQTIDERKKLEDFVITYYSQHSIINRVYIYKIAAQNSLLITPTMTKLIDGSFYHHPGFEKAASIKMPEVYVYSDQNPVDRNHFFHVSIGLTNLRTNQIMGVLTFELKLKYLDLLLEKYMQALGSFLIVGRQGEVIYDSSRLFYNKPFPFDLSLSENSNEVNHANRTYFMNSLLPNELNVRVVNLIPKGEIYGKINALNTRIILIALFCLLISGSISIVYSRRLSYKVKVIIDAIRSFRSGNLKQRIQLSKSKDEFYLISKNFNSMSDAIELYIQQSLLQDIKQKETELKHKNAELITLQTQINPHFLYNTLESIRMRALHNHDSEVAHMILTLAKLFRNTISDKTITTVKEEVRNCQTYFSLFEIRYPNQLALQLEVSSQIESIKMIRNILQPLVENYLIHGFDNRRSNNILKIAVFLEGSYLCFNIVDNGMGVPESIISELNGITARKEVAGIGFSNVRNRLQLMYGHYFSLKIFSSLSKGTTIQLRLHTEFNQGSNTPNP